MAWGTYIQADTPSGRWLYRLPADWSYDANFEVISEALGKIRVERGFPEEYTEGWEVSVKDAGPYGGQKPYSTVDWSAGVPA